MRDLFAHDAVLTLPPAADLQAPGAAITAELCGFWEHEPPCPLAPHHSQVTRIGPEVHVRTLFATEPERESMVRKRIDMVLTRGELEGPDGARTRWQLRSSARSAVRPDELARGERLAGS